MVYDETGFPNERQAMSEPITLEIFTDYV